MRMRFAVAAAFIGHAAVFASSANQPKNTSANNGRNTSANNGRKVRRHRKVIGSSVIDFGGRAGTNVGRHLLGSRNEEEAFFWSRTLGGSASIFSPSTIENTNTSKGNSGNKKANEKTTNKNNEDDGMNSGSNGSESVGNNSGGNDSVNVIPSGPGGPTTVASGIGDANGGSLCFVSEDGSYGDVTSSASQEVLEYIYEVEAFDDLDDEMLQSIKGGIANALVKEFVDGCQDDSMANTVSIGRNSASSTIVGISPLPGDRIVDEEQCVPVEPSNSCSVVQGSLTLFSSDGTISGMRKDEALDVIESAMSEGVLDNMHDSIVRVTYLRDGNLDVDDNDNGLFQSEGESTPTGTSMSAGDNEKGSPSSSSDNEGSSSSIIIGVVLGTISAAIIALAVGGYAYRKRGTGGSEVDLSNMSDEHNLLSEEQSIGSNELNGDVAAAPSTSSTPPPAAPIIASPIMSGTFQ